MIKKIISWVNGLFKKKETFYPQYEFVECKLDDMMTMTGIRILEGQYANLIFSIPSKVQISKTEDGSPKLIYKHQVEYLPSGMVIGDDLSKIIGDIIVDTIFNDLNSGE